MSDDRFLSRRFARAPLSVRIARAVCAAILAGVFVASAFAQTPRPNPNRTTAATPAQAPTGAAPAAPQSGGGLFGRIFGRGGGGGGAGAKGDARRRALLEAYPGAFRFEGNTIVFASGERVVWDDGRRKSPAELLTDADVEDMFAYPYPRAREGQGRPPRAHDPGRVRSDAFFRALYGGSARAVGATVEEVAWVPRLGGGRLTVTTRQGVARQLAAASAELERLPQSFHKYLRPSAGAFLWRQIAGTNRLSVHAFGAAVDINTHYAHYWRWDKQPGDGTVLYRNEIPLEIVEVFERYCFIWGGRWYHYDTMHFEYRPELLPGCTKV